MLDDYFDFADLFNDYIQSFIRQYGELKSGSISQKVYNSNAISSVIASAKKVPFLPKHKILIEALLGTRHFMFSTKHVLTFAALIAFKRSLEELEKDGFYFSNDEKLNAIKGIIIEGNSF